MARDGQAVKFIAKKEAEDFPACPACPFALSALPSLPTLIYLPVLLCLSASRCKL